MQNSSLHKIFFILCILLIQSLHIYGQGCSDAGFCTIDMLQPNSDDGQISDQQLKFGISVGSADNSISILSDYVEYNNQLTESFGLSLKITSISQSGNEISVWGLSDAFLNANIGLTESLNMTVGTKIPFSQANRSRDGLPLPMDYQSSLGTFDIIIGFASSIGRLQWATALQQPLSQNKNEFLATEYPVGSLLREFASTNEFKRSGDVLLRLSYPIILQDKLNLTPSILPIYHLANDKYTDASNIEREITGSQGLTLNANVYLDYLINESHGLQLNIGAPLIIRDVRPDGLTRGFIATVEYAYRF